MPGWTDPDLPPPLLDRRPAPMNVGAELPGRTMQEAPHDAEGYYTCPCGTDRHGTPYNRRGVFHAHKATEQVNWPIRYGSQVRTILEVRCLNTVTFQVVRDRWDDAHPETTP